MNLIDGETTAPLRDESPPPWKRLAIVFIAMFVAQAFGSAFNITYNLTHLAPLLTPAQKSTLAEAIHGYNLTAYPVLVLMWGLIVFGLRRRPRSEKERTEQRRRLINLPLIATVIAAFGWGLCGPVLLFRLHAGEEPLAPAISFHLPVSVGLAMAIALTLGYFAIDWLRQALLFPYFFHDVSPARVPGTFRLSIANRGRLWTLAGSVCPVLALLLLLISPAPPGDNLWFAVAVAVAATGIFCSAVSAALMGRIVLRPIEELRHAAQEVEKGNLEVSVDNLRADEFAILADEFNAMVGGLREKERVERTFGRHVGREIARQLLQSAEELEGVEREISVLFADIRGFTTRCEGLSPKQAVTLLNLYHEHMTAVIEDHGGIVNQLVGDGMMALFGAAGRRPRHAADSIAAGTAMIRGLAPLNARLAEHDFEPVRIGVGVNTGFAVVGTIGSPRRMEYTAIGDTVNTAARIEGMTKEAGTPLLISRATWEAADPKPSAERLDPREVRGRREQIVLYAVSV